MNFVLCEIESVQACTEYEGQVFEYDVYVQCGERRLRIFDPHRIAESGGLAPGMTVNLVVGIGFTGDCVISDSPERIKVGADEYKGRIVGEIMLDAVSPTVHQNAWAENNPAILVQADFGTIIASKGEVPEQSLKRVSSLLGLFIGFVGAPRLELYGVVPISS